MAEFLTTADTTAEIERIINGAKKNLVLICPFIKIPENLFQNLTFADKQGVKITLVYGKSELKPEERIRLRQLGNVSLYFLENLHAKCFYNEESMVITSFNLYNASTENREMGVLINTKDDSVCFRDAVAEARRIVDLAIEIVDSAIEEEAKRPESRAYRYEITQNGYCIRCGTSIPCNLGHPYCRGCFSEWSVWGNPNYEESCCHTCGQAYLTTIEKPLCDSCYYR